MAGKPQNTEETFWKKVDIKGPNDCWEKQGWKDCDGYRFYCYQGREWRAHRLAYTFAKGPIPEGLVVMHSCDNTACCNPAHLSVGTQADNVHDMISKGRSRGNTSNHPYARRAGFPVIAGKKKFNKIVEAAAYYNKSSDFVIGRLRNNNFPDWYYL